MLRYVYKIKDIFKKSKLLPTDENGIRTHKHTIIRAKVSNPPMIEEKCEEWFMRLINKIDMKVMVNPKAYYCDKKGNRGLTCVAIIETSHITLHSWDECEPAIVEMDVFSCKDYDINDVVSMLKEFGLISLDVRCIDRTKGLKEETIATTFEMKHKYTNACFKGIASTKNVSIDEILSNDKILKNKIDKLGGACNFNFVIKKVEIF